MDIAYGIRNRYEELIREIDREYYNDYIDQLTVDPDEPHHFTLKYVPVENNLRLRINGVWYIPPTYVLDRTNKTLEWIFTKANGGFDILPSFNVTAFYDITLADNPDLDSLDDIV